MEFKVGYNRQTVNPTEPIPLQGYSNEPQRLHKAITEDICATAVAYSDGTTTVMTIGTDLCTLLDPLATDARLGVCAATGLKEDQVFIAATHTHSGPALHRDEFESVVRYKQQFLDGIILAAKEAIADLKPAKMYAGSIETENLNFVKHYKMRDTKTGEISCIGDQYGTDVGKVYVDHMTKADPTLHIVKFTREGGKDVVIANFRAHPHFTGGYKKYDLSSDYIGAFRMAFEAMYDCHCVYFQGASGNINSSTRMAGERKYTTCRSHGMALAAAAYECMLKHLKEVNPGPIKYKQLKFYADINHSMNHLAEEGQRIWTMWRETYDKAACDVECAKVGLHSIYHAWAVYANSTRTREKDGLLILNAVSLGEELAFVTFPGELFDSLSVRMENGSPFQTTMLLGYCYHHLNYLPSMAAFKYGSYEVDTTRFKPGTGEEVADTYVEMLKELKN